MPVFTSSIELSDDYPSIQPSLNLNFAGSRALDPRITFTRDSVGTYVDKNGLIKTAGEDEARFDHDPLTLESLGLLIEEGRTNYVNNSTNPNWFSVASAVNETTYPIKGLATIRLTDSPSDGDSPYLTCDPSGLSTGSSTAMSMSIYVDAVNSTSDTITLYLFGGGYIAHSWNISTGVPVATESFSLNGANYSNGSQEIIDCGGGIYRLILKSTYNGTTTTAVRFYLAPSGGATDYVIIAGPQIEQGAFPTSYIPTSGASATRNADSPCIDGESFDEFYNQSEGTIVSSHSILEGIPANHNLYTYQVAPDSGTSEAPFRLLDKNGSYGNTLVATSVNSSSSVSLFKASGDPVTVANTKMKVAFAIKKDDFAVSFNGTATQTDTDGLVSETNDHLSIGYYKPIPQAYLNGHIQRLTYYPKRLSNAQLQLLTS